MPPMRMRHYWETPPQRGYRSTFYQSTYKTPFPIPSPESTELCLAVDVEKIRYLVNSNLVPHLKNYLKLYNIRAPPGKENLVRLVSDDLMEFLGELVKDPTSGIQMKLTKIDERVVPRLERSRPKDIPFFARRWKKNIFHDLKFPVISGSTFVRPMSDPILLESSSIQYVHDFDLTDLKLKPEERLVLYVVESPDKLLNTTSELRLSCCPISAMIDFGATSADADVEGKYDFTNALKTSLKFTFTLRAFLDSTHVGMGLQKVAQWFIVRGMTKEEKFQSCFTQSPKRNALDLLSSQFTANVGVESTGSSVSLICPLGKTRIKMPGKGSACRHLQCFDLQLFYNMYEKRQHWQCPVCNCGIAKSGLRQCEYFVEILSLVPSECFLAKISPTGDISWTAPPEASENVIDLTVTEDVYEPLEKFYKVKDLPADNFAPLNLPPISDEEDDDDGYGGYSGAESDEGSDYDRDGDDFNDEFAGYFDDYDYIRNGGWNRQQFPGRYPGAYPINQVIPRARPIRPWPRDGESRIVIAIDDDEEQMEPRRKYPALVAAQDIIVID